MGAPTPPGRAEGPAQTLLGSRSPSGCISASQGVQTLTSPQAPTGGWAAKGKGAHASACCPSLVPPRCMATSAQQLLGHPPGTRAHPCARGRGCRAPTWQRQPLAAPVWVWADPNGPKAPGAVTHGGVSSGRHRSRQESIPRGCGCWAETTCLPCAGPGRVQERLRKTTGPNQSPGCLPGPPGWVLGHLCSIFPAVSKTTNLTFKLKSRSMPSPRSGS